MLSEACSCCPRGDDIAVEACLNLKDTSNQPPMSFQRGHVRWLESMGGGAKKLKPIVTASTAIDPMPLPASPRGDDIAVEACFRPARE